MPYNERMTENQRIGIIGSGGQADEAESYERDKKIAFHAVDARYIREHEQQINVEEPSESERETSVVAAIGAPAVRKMLIEKWPGKNYHTITSEHAVIDPTARIGKGCIIAPGAMITTNVEIGSHSIINVAATVSHNSKLGDYVTVSPGAHIAGNVRLGEGVFIGIGATVSNGISVASGVVVGAGAVVIRSIEEDNSVYVGVPAKKIAQNDGWLNEI